MIVMAMPQFVGLLKKSKSEMPTASKKNNIENTNPMTTSKVKTLMNPSRMDSP